MADDNKKKFNVNDALSHILGGEDINKKETIKAIIILIFFITAIIFVIFPFIIGMGFQFGTSSIFSIAGILGILLAISVVIIGGSK
ncbi:MAG: hypothetical protein PHN56_00945 [Candidatus Nanoarchaeia archaeon]|nr:hypothetical protein [Candidatus Nanoarchaeia archaeon]